MPPYPVPTSCRRVFIPFYGYLDADDELRARVDRFFHVPMLVLALLVLPILGLEYIQASQAEAPPASGAGTPHPLVQGAVNLIRTPAMRIAVDGSMVFIWLAFLVEFVVKITIAQSRGRYATRNWLDIVIILLPMLRPLRATGALRGARGARALRLTRVFTLRGVVMKLLRTAAAMVLGLTFVRRLQERARKPGAEIKHDYEKWPRSALIAEIRRLNAEVRAMERKQEERSEPRP